MHTTPLIAFDQHAATTVAAVLLPGQQTPALHSLASDTPTILRFARRIARHGAVRCCYEAGPCGFELQRALRAHGIACDVILIAQLPEVKWIAEKTYASLQASATNPAAIPMLLQNNGGYTTVTATGWKLWNAGIDGGATNQIVTMEDTGLNTNMEHFAQNVASAQPMPDAMECQSEKLAEFHVVPPSVVCRYVLSSPATQQLDSEMQATA